MQGMVAMNFLETFYQMRERETKMNKHKGRERDAHPNRLASQAFVYVDVLPWRQLREGVDCGRKSDSYRYSEYRMARTRACSVPSSTKSWATDVMSLFSERRPALQLSHVFRHSSLGNSWNTKYQTEARTELTKT